MSRLWIKICGLRTAESAEAAAAAGADAVGFVFHAASPRHLEVDAAAALRSAVPAGVERVAVFRHPSPALVAEVVEALRPDWVQTDAADFEALSLPPAVRALPVLRVGDAWPARLPRRCLVEGAASGTGETTDWNAVARIARDTQVILAGGLDASNVAEAVRQVRPFGVDVSSGVEAERGVKDPARIRDFIRAARGAEQACEARESR